MLVSNPRERRMNELLARGYATCGEILEADFGTKSPNGLQLEALLETIVDFRSIFSDRNLGILSKLHWSVFKGGYVRNLSSDIYLNNFLFINLFSERISPNKASIIGHENTHVMQGMSEEGSRAGSIAGKFFEKEDSSGSRGLFSKAMTILDRGAGLAMGTEESEKGFVRGYLRNGVEIQARLHEILASGYQTWGRMPTTRHELWAALASQGMSPPPEIRRQLNETPEGQEAQKVFGILKFYAIDRAAPSLPTLSPAKDLNVVAKSTGTLKGRENFWTELMPEMYGSLLEMYGDKYGLERIGLSPLSDYSSDVAPYKETAARNSLQRTGNPELTAKFEDVMKKLGDVPEPLRTQMRAYYADNAMTAAVCETLPKNGRFLRVLQKEGYEENAELVDSVHALDTEMCRHVSTIREAKNTKFLDEMRKASQTAPAGTVAVSSSPRGSSLRQKFFSVLKL